MTRVIENNGPSYLLVGISDALEMIEAGDVSAAVAELRICKDIAQKVVDWVRDLQEAGMETPPGLNWTERLRKENERKRVARLVTENSTYGAFGKREV